MRGFKEYLFYRTPLDNILRKHMKTEQVYGDQIELVATNCSDENYTYGLLMFSGVRERVLCKRMDKCHIYYDYFLLLSIMTYL